MREILRAFGGPLSLVIGTLVGFWLLILVAVPQVAMLDYSLWSQAANADLSAAIDRAYAEATMAEFDRRAEANPAKATELDEKLTALKRTIAELEAAQTSPPKTYGLQNYTRMSPLHAYIFVRTILSALAVAAVALVVCYPIAYAAAFAPTPRRAAILLTALLVPYAMNELLRVYAWLMIFDYRGVLNSLFAAVGLADLEARRWVPFLETQGALFTVMVSVYALFMVFPIMNTLQTLDPHQIEAARDLGASAWRIHARVVIPHAKPGIAVGVITVFMLAAGSFAVPQILSRGTGGDWFSQLVYRQFFEANNWNLGSAYAFSLLVVSLAIVFAMMRAFGVSLREITK
ncbi:ABC transporter permease [Chelatococcus sp. SYSU_G07232]|uniref:ABC transporter permease n=1 Tax=Chelatococcus albus TaxID=3047466 RepID=A0ABT7AIP6_9HYPH|nr:ABC transporter permease [Chelatococcus sp. SYSU_G07232]MDJ1159248.1 ABC transporter permease [Chelatococcus sp. SYSU_G07232]